MWRSTALVRVVAVVVACADGLLGMSCWGRDWVGLERAHCCRRTAGCGKVFDDVQLFDAHRRGGGCGDPRAMGLVQTVTESGCAPWSTARPVMHPRSPARRVRPRAALAADPRCDPGERSWSAATASCRFRRDDGGPSGWPAIGSGRAGRGRPDDRARGVADTDDPDGVPVRAVTGRR